MLGADNFHSRLVGWFKIILPLAALGLLSTLFLLARDGGPPPELSFSELQEMAREQRVSSPRSSGVTENGAVVRIEARSATPSENGTAIVSIDGVTLNMDHPDQTNVEVTATSGEVDASTQTAHFYGLATLQTSSGYQMETNGLVAELKTGVITSEGVLEVHAPFGELTAGQVTLRVSPDNVGQHILFTGGVQLLYQPQTAERDDP